VIVHRLTSARFPKCDGEGSRLYGGRWNSKGRAVVYTAGSQSLAARAQQQALLQADLQMKLKVIEQDRYQEHGRLVPEMPTDDGVTLRKAILSEDCMNDVVRPLRDAGWGRSKRTR